MLLKLLGELFCSQNVPAKCVCVCVYRLSVCACVCVCAYVCVRESDQENGEGKVSLCDEILKSLSLNFLTDLRRGSQSTQPVSFLSPTFTYKIMFDLPGFSWGSNRQKEALLSAAHEHEDVC